MDYGRLGNVIPQLIAQENGVLTKEYCEALDRMDECILFLENHVT